MKISYRTAGSGSYTVLADLGASTPDLIFGFLPSYAGESQVEALYGAQHKRVFDRGNSAWSISFSVAREHNDSASATSFLATHGVDLSGLKDLKIEEGGTTLYLTRCRLTRMQPAEETNKSSVISYQWIGEQYTATEP